MESYKWDFKESNKIKANSVEHDFSFLANMWWYLLLYETEGMNEMQ